MKRNQQRQRPDSFKEEVKTNLNQQGLTKQPLFYFMSYFKIGMQITIDYIKKEITLVNGTLEEIAKFLAEKETKFYKNFKVIIES